MDICIFIPVRMTAVSQFWLIKPSHKTYPSVINKNKDCSLPANESHSGISCFSFLNQSMSLYPRLSEQPYRALRCWELEDVPCAHFPHTLAAQEMKNRIRRSCCQPRRSAPPRGDVTRVCTEVLTHFLYIATY